MPTATFYPGNVQVIREPGRGAWQNDILNVKSETDGGASATIQLRRFQESEILYVHDFGFSIGGNATSIIVTARVKADNNGRICTSGVRLYPKSSRARDTRLPAKRWTTAFTDQKFGDSADGDDPLWGMGAGAWKPERVNSPDFGVYFQCDHVDGRPTMAYVDWINVTITW